MVTVRTPASSSSVSTVSSLMSASRLCASTQNLQRFFIERAQLLAQAHFPRPVWIVQQRAPDLHEIEFSPCKTLQQRLEVVGRGRSPIPLRVVDALVEPNAAHCHAQLARDLFGPAGQ